MKKLSRILALALMLCMMLSLAACGGTGSQTQDSAPSEDTSAPDTAPDEAPEVSEPNDIVPDDGAYAANYKGQTNYESIAEQLRADATLDLNGLDSEMFTITGYAQGYNFDDAWFGSLGQMVNSGEEVVLASGSGQFPFNFGGLPRTAAETDVRVGGVDSLTQEFADLLDGGVYAYCSGSHPSMIGPAVALVLRALEGDKLVDSNGEPAAVNMSHVIVHSAEELAEVMAEDGPGNYAYNAAVISAFMDMDYDTFIKATSNKQWDGIKANKDAYGGGEVKTLSREYTIGLLRNDTTSDEALAYEGYLTDLANAMGFKIIFSVSTEGNPTNEVNQIQTWASAGYDAIISMTAGSPYDQVDTAGANNMVAVMFAAHPVEADRIDLVELDNYLGAVGPSKYNEAESGYRLAKYYIDNGYTDFAIFGGSIMYGAEQHAYRVGGIIAAMIEKETGVPNTDFN